MRDIARNKAHTLKQFARQFFQTAAAIADTGIEWDIGIATADGSAMVGTAADAGDEAGSAWSITASSICTLSCLCFRASVVNAISVMRHPK